MARQIFQLEETIERMTQHSGREHVAAVLVDLVDGSDAGGAGEITLNQVQIAKLAGLTRESVARAISSLRDDGIVSRRGQLRILEMERLRRAATPQR
jgi:CRP-like cAMP-binding protein